jgi:hypothetical protein
MKILRRPMFSKGGSTNEGIMHGLDRSGYAGGGTIGGGTIQGTDLGYRTGFSTFAPIGSSPVAYTGTEGLISQGMAEELAQSPAALKKAAEKNPWLMRLLPWLRFSGAAAIGSGIGGLADFYLRSTDTPQAYAERKKIIDEDRFAYDETNLDVGELFERVSEKQKIGEPPGFFPRGGKKKWYEEKGIDPETGKATRIDVTEPPGGTQLPSYKKPNGDLNNITNQDLAAIAKDAKETLKEKNKRYMEMMAPHMQKRMVADALGAASEAFGESTGNTRQDIANAISAAAKGMGGTKDIYDKVSMLTLQGEIMKDVEASKTKKLTKGEEYEEMRKKYPEVYKDIVKTQSPEDKFLTIVAAYGGGAEGRKMAVKNQWKDDESFFGVLKSDAKQQKKQIKAMPDSAIGKIVYDANDDSYYKIIVNEDGDKDKEFLGQRKG